MDCVSPPLSTGRTLQYLSESSVQSRIVERGFASDGSLANLPHSDLTTHVYEGGFKVWECSLDLCEAIESDPSLVRGKRILELGCGAALPSISALLNGASSAVLQDFNKAVLDCFTTENLQINNCDLESVKMVSGSWKDLPGVVPSKSCDVILSSETIYNVDDYESLVSAIEHCLAEGGMALVAAKVYYFGLSGSAVEFEEYAKKRGLAVTRHALIQAPVPRLILRLANN